MELNIMFVRFAGIRLIHGHASLKRYGSEGLKIRASPWKGTREGGT